MTDVPSTQSGNPRDREESTGVHPRPSTSSIDGNQGDREVGTGIDPRPNASSVDGSPPGRGISTVLDVSLATLVVGAAIVTLAGVPTPPTDDVGTDPADGLADSLGSVTAEIDYSLSPGAVRADDRLLEFPRGARSGPRFRRTARGPVAALIARAAVGDVAVDGEQLTHSTDELERRAAKRAVAVAGDAGTSVQVRAVWRPFPASDLRGQVVAGTDPPADATVHAATMNVASGLPDARDEAMAAADEGYGAVARVLANATVAGLFPPERSALEIRGDYPRSALTLYRYRHAADLLGTDLTRYLADDDVRTANERLVDVLTTRFRHRIEAAYRTPSAAAKRATVGAVTITVRTWSP